MGQGALEAEVTINATPDRVWEVVSDLEAMKDRSPEVVGMWMRGRPKVGARGVNLNRRKGFVWPTTTRITQWKPPSNDDGRGALAFHVRPTDAVWSYQLEPSGSGTRLIERRSDPQGNGVLVRLTARWALGGKAGHDIELQAGMHETLAKVKTAAEG
ncbi:SRPBCC family protein [Aeromicrobium sp.]|uniref:SRPBCC family protein n=1 Tax=Aeromicrobium sp. TaxID=1871063 RepID=UPI0019861556|nr:SRPBCC family protein [Aeromicrobium sp.]MBC7632046.1 SRPBCC family protein [Aeromicrobium sp.]